MFVLNILYNKFFNSNLITINQLPNEIIHLIAKTLDVKTQNSFIQTSTKYYHLVNSQTYRKDILRIFESILIEEKNFDPSAVWTVYIDPQTAKNEENQFHLIRKERGSNVETFRASLEYSKIFNFTH